MSPDRLGLFDTSPNREQIRLALAITGMLFVAALLIIPVRDIRWPEIPAFIPVIDSIMFVGELITATLLYAQATVFRSRSLTVLASGYVVTALLLVAHALAFPGAFAPDGLLGDGVNTPGWLSKSLRAAFPIAVILYVCLKKADAVAEPGAERPSERIVAGPFSAIILAVLVTILTTIGHRWLPPFFANRSDLIYSHAFWIEAVLLALFIVAAALLFSNRPSVLDMWLLVALSGWIFQSPLTMTLQGRFTAGWYCLFVMTLASHLTVMLALIAESNRLYARLALSTAARHREREARLMTMDAVTAAISHEVGQPLTAVGLNATAGLNWLTRAQPDVDKAIVSLRAIREDRQRTVDIINSIREMFGTKAASVTTFSVNDVVRETAVFLDRELVASDISLELNLDDALPDIMADRVQVQRVVLNLFTNAIESLGAIRGRPRYLGISSIGHDDSDVLVEVTDHGIGIPPEDAARIFDAFFTTKTGGTGLGLSLCRTIIEDHGGRLWAAQNEPYGATFHLQLPCRPRAK